MNGPYRWSSITAADVAAWAELTNHLAAVEGTEDFCDAEDRLEELQDPAIDPQRDTLAAWHGHHMVGFGTVAVRPHPDSEGRIRVGIEGGVHPEHRGRGVGTAVMERMEARGGEAAQRQHPGWAFHFDTGGGLAGSSARAFHHRRGYETARHFHLMSRPLSPSDSSGQLLPSPTSADVVIRAPEPQEEEAVLQAHRAAFADHWGSAPPSAERWHEKWTSRSSRHRVSRIAVDDSGAVLAYSLCGQWVERELYVNLLGTVPSARGHGLGSAVLAHTIEAAAASRDYSVIELEVDSESLTGATRLYERMGFSIKHTSALMRKRPAP